MKIRRIKYEHCADTYEEWSQTHWKKIDGDKIWNIIYRIKRALYEGPFDYKVISNPYDCSIRIFGWNVEYGWVEYQIKGFRLNRKDWNAFREWHRRQTGEWPA